MLKNICVSGLLVLTLQAESFQKKPISFDIFLQKAIQTSPYLKSSALAVDQAKEQGSLLTRYANPTLEGEYSKFNPDVGDSDNGFRVNYSQPVRLWSVEDDRKALALATRSNANAIYRQQRAVFIRDLSLQFTLYSQQKMLLDLGNEELLIAKKIYDISKARYESGTISRGFLLQSQVDYEIVKSRNEALNLASSQSYYTLLRRAGLNEEVELDTTCVFDLMIRAKETAVNPDLAIIKSQQDQANSETKLNSNKIEWMNVFAEYESEPEQDILRAGINFPLAIFNTKSQERAISKLQASRSELLLKNENSRLDIELNRLHAERSSLHKQVDANEEVLKTEMELLVMFQEGYKIANINLLQLQDAKNKVIGTKRTLIQVNTALDQNTIITNYNQGSYNE